MNKLSELFKPKYVFTTSDAVRGTLYLTKGFWFKFAALECLMFHNKFKTVSNLEENEIYGLEYTVINTKTGEIIK